jgi:hypothetical protein
MTVVAMSHGELSRFDTLMRVERGELRVDDAAVVVLGLERRQIFRLLGRLRAGGAEGVVSQKRGKPSNRRYGDAFRNQVTALVRTHYADFGPTLAREYLAERHGVRLSCETLRQIMIAAGLWKDREARRLQAEDGRKLPIGTVVFEPRDGRTRYEIRLDHTRLTRYFLSMLGFECLTGKTSSATSPIRIPIPMR